MVQGTENLDDIPTEDFISYHISQSQTHPENQSWKHTFISCRWTAKFLVFFRDPEKQQPIIDGPITENVFHNNCPDDSRGFNVSPRCIDIEEMNIISPISTK